MENVPLDIAQFEPESSSLFLPAKLSQILGFPAAKSHGVKRGISTRTRRGVEREAKH